MLLGICRYSTFDSFIHSNWCFVDGRLGYLFATLMVRTHDAMWMGATIRRSFISGGWERCIRGWSARGWIRSDASIRSFSFFYSKFKKWMASAKMEYLHRPNAKFKCAMWQNARKKHHHQWIIEFYLFTGVSWVGGRGTNSKANERKNVCVRFFFRLWKMVHRTQSPHHTTIGQTQRPK